MEEDYEDVYLSRPDDGEAEVAAHIGKLEEKYNTNSNIILQKLDDTIGALFSDLEKRMRRERKQRLREKAFRACEVIYGPEATLRQIAQVKKLLAVGELLRAAGLGRSENITPLTPEA